LVKPGKKPHPFQAKTGHLARVKNEMGLGAALTGLIGEGFEPGMGLFGRLNPFFIYEIYVLLYNINLMKI
jgi:hypothetical protein